MHVSRVSQCHVSPYVAEGELLDGLAVVVVALLDLLLAGGEVRAEEDEGGGVVGEADAHRALVTRGPAHPSLHVLHVHIPAQSKLDH